MSLVNEALKKARLEAARQEAARRGLPLPGAPRAASRRMAPAVLFRVGVAAAVVVLAALIFFAGRRFSPAPAAAPRTATAESVAARTTSPRPAADGVEPPAADRAEPDAASTRPAATPVVPAPPPAAATNRGATPPADVAVPEETGGQRSTRASQSRVRTAWEPRSEPTADRAASEPSAPSAPSPRARQVEPERPAPAPETRPEPIRTAVRRLELPGSVRVELGGIAWSEERPFALINGRVVGPGDRVESLTVVAVEPRHVELRGQDGLYLLRLK